MARSIVLDTEFTDTTLPILLSFEEQILAISSLAGWFTARVADLTLDGSDRVSAWANRKTSGTMTLAQATSGRQPLYLADQVNGNGALSFDSGRPDFLAGTNFPTGVDIKWTKVLVFQATALGANAHILSENGEHALYVETSTNHLKDWINGGPTVGTVAVADSNFHAAVAAYDSDIGKVSLKIDTNATQTSTGTAIAATLTDFSVGTNQHNSTSGAWSGKIADILIFQEDLLATANADHLEVIRGYLATRYDLDI